MPSLKFYAKRSRKESYYVFTHSHSAYELVYYIEGNVKATIGGESYRFSPGMVSIVPPGVLHDERCITDATTMWCIFEPEELEICAKCAYTVKELDGTFLPVLLERMAQEIDTKGANHSAMMQLLLSEALLEFSRLTANRLPSAAEYPEKAVEYACGFMKDNFARPIDFSLIAAQVGYSYDRFRHIFKEQTGCSPHRFLIELRVNKAKKLCKETNLKLSEISAQCGFLCPSKMISTFRAETGVTPIQYRKHKFRNDNGLKEERNETM